MSRYKDLTDPALAAELRRRARAAAELKTALAAAPAEPPSLQLPAADAVSPAFANLIGEVNPLATAARSRSRPAPPEPHPRQRLADEERALRDSQAATNPSPMAWDVGLDIEGAQSFVRNGLNPDLLRKLRRGDWVQGSLDLHRHTQEEARVALGEFLAAARRQGWRCVRIVHGKGLSSPNREPVLKAKVRKWLQLRDEVLAYCEPRPHAGGGGAVVVLLGGA
jgi:DNA-nicking Smr family endonuclease